MQSQLGKYICLGQIIKNLTNVSKRTNDITTFYAGIYSIPCKDYDKYYIGKT